MEVLPKWINLFCDRKMIVILAFECGGHVFWQRNKYEFMQLSTDTGKAEPINLSLIFQKNEPNYYNTGLEIEYYFTEKGVEAQFFACGSGFGKVPHGERFVAIPCELYDSLVVMENRQKRIDEQNYNGNWQDNSDFEQI